MADTSIKTDKVLQVLHSIPPKKHELQKETGESSDDESGDLIIEYDEYGDITSEEESTDESSSFYDRLHEDQQLDTEKPMDVNIFFKPIGTGPLKKQTLTKLHGKRTQFDVEGLKDEEREVQEIDYHGKTDYLSPPTNDVILSGPSSSIKEEFCDETSKQHFGDKLLPDEEILLKLIKAKNYSSKDVRVALSNICQYIKQMSPNIRHVWPAYRWETNEEEKTSIVFVVHSSKHINIDCKYTTYQRFEDEITDASISENEMIYKAEQLQKYKIDEMAKLRAFIKSNARKFMSKHSNLTKVSASYVKSSRAAHIENIPCIALYVQIKGLVPVLEEPFDKTITEFPIDVREGVFTLCGKPDALHQKVKMGCAIDSGYGTSQGTIGPFVQLQNHEETFFLTSAHVALNKRQMEKLTKNKNEYTCIYYGISGNNTFQPPESKTVKEVNSRHHLGKIEMAVFKEGNENEAGMELALVQINKDREPVDGYFPEDISSSQTGAWSNERFQFSSGKILEREKLSPMSNVYKFGCSSGLTEGLYRDECTSVRTNKLEGRGLGVDFTLYNQIQVENRQFSEPFAKQGDSGSLVFAMDESDSFAVGIFEGTMEPYYMVTPIKDAINVIGKHLSFHKTDYSSFNTGHRTNSEDIMEFESYGNLKVIELPFETQADPKNSRNPIIELEKKTSNIETNIIHHTEHTFGTVKGELTAMKAHIDQSDVEMRKYLDEQFAAIKNMIENRNDKG